MNTVAGTRRVALIALMTLVPLVTPFITRTAAAQQVAYAASVLSDMDSVTTAAVSREIARARDRGLPVEPLVAKVREGRLKRATGPRIRLAVARLAERLDSARAALGAEASTEELIAGAQALAVGAGSPALRTLRLSTPRRIEVPLGTLAQLVASGVPPSRAVEMLVALLRRNAAPTQIAALGNLVESDVASGLRAGESAAIRLRGVEASIGFGDNLSTADAPRGVSTTPGPNRSKPVRRP